MSDSYRSGEVRIIARLLRATLLFQLTFDVIGSRPEIPAHAELEVLPPPRARPPALQRSNVLPMEQMRQQQEREFCGKFSEPVCEDRCKNRVCDLCPSGTGCLPNVCPDRSSKTDGFEFGYTSNWTEELCSVLKERGYNRADRIVITDMSEYGNICYSSNRPRCDENCWEGTRLGTTEVMEKTEVMRNKFPLKILVEDVEKITECKKMCADINSCFISQGHASSDACQPLKRDWVSSMIDNPKEPKALWTGGIGTSMRARLNGHPTLESNSVAQAIMAVVGSCMAFRADGMVPYEVWQEHYAGLFNTISVDFVNMMQNSAIHIYFTHIDPEKTLMTQELPSIARNPYIHTAVFHPLVSSRTGNQVEGMVHSPDEIQELPSVTMALERSSQNQADIEAALKAQAIELSRSLPQ